MSKMVIAVDGPAGSGKSSVCKAVAKQLGYAYLDTGAGYRAFTYHAITNPEFTREQLVETFAYEISLDPEFQQVWIAENDVTTAIRTPLVAERVSEFARDLEIRKLQISDAQSRILNCPEVGIVVEGRDITTVVAPEAQLRVLLTANEEVRLQRRGLEQTESAENLKGRDASDSKVAQFLTAAPGVKVLDTTNLDFNQSVSALIDLVREVEHD